MTPEEKMIRRTILCRFLSACYAAEAELRVDPIVSLGCSLSELKAHLESKFVDGMTWNTYGTRGGWNIDHIVPLRAHGFADITRLDHQLRLCHYTNLRPLFASQNSRRARQLVEAELRELGLLSGSGDVSFPCDLLPGGFAEPADPGRIALSVKLDAAPATGNTVCSHFHHGLYTALAASANKHGMTMPELIRSALLKWVKEDK